MGEKIFQNIEQKEKEPKEIREFGLNKGMQTRYNKIAKYWENEAYDGTRRDDLIPDLMKFSNIEDGMKILDAMCGTSKLLKEMKKDYPKCDYFALDFSMSMLNEVSENVNRIMSSVTLMPFQEKTVDRVFVRSGIHDLPRMSQSTALSEIKRVLKEDGIFILQAYYTNLATQRYYNSIVNFKDRAAGNYYHPDGLPAHEFPRHFATKKELEEMFEDIGFDYEVMGEFEGVITYCKTKELQGVEVKKIGEQKTEETFVLNPWVKEWIFYMQTLPDEIKELIKLRSEDGVDLVYNFPGMIYKLVKKG